jgi:hypothetical protein
MLDKLETGRVHLGGSVEHSEGKDGEGVVAILRFLCGSPRLCWLRTEGLVPMSKYWTYRSHAGDMSPVSLVAYHRQKLDLNLLLHWLAWERNWVQTRRSVSRRAMDCVGSPFLGSSGIRPNRSMTHERLPRTETTHRKRASGVHGLAWEAYVSYWLGFPLQGVHRFELLWLSHMRNCLFVTAIK